ncbi:MAG: winged helix-turn-helix transcriptional regulator [Nanoarchaeota archaeon]|nr:winged helix-turn-helix transcriptional regulator [Nanoarchaeota archaeon]
MLKKKEINLLSELEKNSRISLSELGKNISISKENANYLIKKFQKQDFIFRFETITNYTKLGLVGYQLNLKLNFTSRRKYHNFKEYIEKNTTFKFSHFCEGYYDFIGFIYVTSITKFNEVYHELKLILKESIIDEKISILTESKKYCIFDREKHVEFSYYSISEEQYNKISESDKKILQELEENSRTPVTEIAKKNSLSTRTTMYSIKKMENEGLILGYSLMINASAFKFTRYIIDISVKNIQSIPEIIYFFKEKNLLRASYQRLNFTNLSLEILCPEGIIIQDLLFDFRELYNKSFHQCEISLVREVIF